MFTWRNKKKSITINTASFFTIMILNGKNSFRCGWSVRQKITELTQTKSTQKKYWQSLWMFGAYLIKVVLRFFTEGNINYFDRVAPLKVEAPLKDTGMSRIIFITLA